ncbi:hypothetical protein fh0823_20160 [Francisella halioticida]|uniref:hypothetical protein n=1 Tax=Francisella halioticida TaxID=549298 RepID=UPI0012F8FBD4|nr:hypothetical protein [Francisella halioticida]BCD91877.1 hypothetical protein fh0823_20160 [Francisella halioticida]
MPNSIIFTKIGYSCITIMLFISAAVIANTTPIIQITFQIIFLSLIINDLKQNSKAISKPIYFKDKDLIPTNTIKGYNIVREIRMILNEFFTVKGLL